MMKRKLSTLVKHHHRTRKPVATMRNRVTLRKKAAGAPLKPRSIVGVRPSRRVGVLSLRRHGRPTVAGINRLNRLAGPEGVNQTGPVIEKKKTLEWPKQITSAFAISMRPQRWQGMKARLGPWANRVKLWNATNGYTIDTGKWIKSGKLSAGSRLRRGEIGCYDSHVRIWQHIVTNKIPVTLIMEDDANVRYTESHARKLKAAFDELETIKGWHFMYVGRSNNRTKRAQTPHLKSPLGLSGLFAYVLSLEGAKVLLQSAFPFRIPVDVLVSNAHDKGKIIAAALSPPLCYVVPVHSDTAGIG
jgi:glycosyl transferase family 25